MGPENVAVGIVGYNDPVVLSQCLDAVFATIGDKIPVVVYDDASWAQNIRMIRQRKEYEEDLPIPHSNMRRLGSTLGAFEKFGEAKIRRLAYIESPVNRGSAHGRNQLWNFAECYGYERMVTLDMDLRVHPGWLSALMNVMGRHADCGIATFTYANDHGGHFPPVEDGEDLRVAETPSMCWLSRVAMFNDCLGPDQVWGMDARMEVFSHDSEFSQRMRRCSYWRMFMSREPLISEFVQHHSSQSSVPSMRARAKTRIDADALCWAELEARRHWEVEKEKA